MIQTPIESGTLHQLGQQHPSKGQDLTLHKQEVRIKFNFVKMQIQPLEEEKYEGNKMERRKKRKEDVEKICIIMTDGISSLKTLLTLPTCTKGKSQKKA